jgi:hypothetical protein
MDLYFEGILLDESYDSSIDDDSGYKDFVSSYLEEEKQTIVCLYQALEEKNYSKIIYIADMIYGHGGSLGFPLISFMGKAIELSAKEQDFFLTSNLLYNLKNYLEFLSK